MVASSDGPAHSTETASFAVSDRCMQRKLAGASDLGNSSAYTSAWRDWRPHVRQRILRAAGTLAPSSSFHCPQTMPSRSLRTALLLACATSLVAFASNPGGTPARPRLFEPDSATPSTVRALLSVLADDSMQGRGTGTDGGDRAAKFIAAQMKKIGLKPGGDSGYFQRVPLGIRADGRRYLLPSLAAFDSLPKAQRRMAVNVIGVIPGYRGILDRVARNDVPASDSVVLIDAHYDHLGIGRPVNGDSIYNGADDDGSGTVAVLEIGRTIHLDDPHRRTIVFLLTTGEEVGLLGARTGTSRTPTPRWARWSRTSSSR